MPTIVGDLGGFALLAWVFAAYMLTQAVTIPIYGRLADLYGRKRILFIGFTIFLVGSLLCGLAPSMLMLVIFRAVQGIGAGAILPVTLTIVGDAYPSIERVKVQPHIASVYAGSSIIGPVLGAFIVQHLTWPLIFWLNIPIGALAMGMLAVFFKEQPRIIKHNLDMAGAALLMTSLTALLVAMLQADKLGWWILLLLAICAVTYFLFLRVERRSPEPLLPPALWRDRTLLASNVGSFAIGGVLMSVSAFLPTYVQGILGGSVFTAGVSLSIMSFSWPVAATVGSRIMVRTTYRTTAVAGGIMLVIGTLMLAGLATVPVEINRHILNGWWPTAAAFVIGAGLGFMNTSLHISMQEAATAHRGIATATQAFMRMLGGTFGTAIVGAALNLNMAWKLPGVHDAVQTIMDPALREKVSAADINRLTGAIGDSLGNSFWLAVLLGIMGFITAWMVPHVRPGRLSEQSAKT